MRRQLRAIVDFDNDCVGHMVAGGIDFDRDEFGETMILDCYVNGGAVVEKIKVRIPATDVEAALRFRQRILNSVNDIDTITPDTGAVHRRRIIAKSEARHEGICPECQRIICVGDRIQHVELIGFGGSTKRWEHETCPKQVA